MGAPKKYSPEFKQRAVRLMMRKSAEQVARELSVPRSALYRWRRQYEVEESQDPTDVEDAPLDGDERRELLALRKRVTQLETERDILKKFAAFFGTENE